MNDIIIKNPFCIEEIHGFTPAISHLVKMMNYARITTIKSVEGLTVDELDYQFSDISNSIGALLAHMAAVDRWFQVFTFEGRMMTEEEMEPIKAAMDLGRLGREKIKGNTLKHYLDELKRVRSITFTELSKRDDEWLLKSIEHSEDYRANYYFEWFHVLEDEVNHRGQIRIIRKMQGR